MAGLKFSTKEETEKIATMWDNFFVDFFINNLSIRKPDIL